MQHIVPSYRIWNSIVKSEITGIFSLQKVS